MMNGSNHSQINGKLEGQKLKRPRSTDRILDDVSDHKSKKYFTNRF